MKNLTRYNCAYESDDDKTRVLTVDKNDDGTYFKMSIDVKNSGTNEEYVRTQAAGTFDIDGISEDMSAFATYLSARSLSMRSCFPYTSYWAT